MIARREVLFTLVHSEVVAMSYTQGTPLGYDVEDRIAREITEVIACTPLYAHVSECDETREGLGCVMQRLDKEIGDAVREIVGRRLEKLGA